MLDHSTISATTTTDKGLFLVFKVNDSEYASIVSDIKHIIRYEEVTEVPGGIKGALGIREVRGGSVPIYDTSYLMGLGARNYGKENFIMLCELDNGNNFGLAVDKMSGSEYIDSTEIVLPAGLEEKKDGYVNGTYNTQNGMLVVIDLDKLVGSIK